jgi:hypothetical protein
VMWLVMTLLVLPELLKTTEDVADQRAAKPAETK